LEKLVDEGKVVRHGFDESYKLAHKRGGRRRLVIARARRKTVDVQGNADVITTSMPDEMLPSALAAPSLTAHVIMENIGKGMPLFRIEDSFAREGVTVDRATLVALEEARRRQARENGRQRRRRCRSGWNPPCRLRRYSSRTSWE
jgi:transposase